MNMGKKYVINNKDSVSKDSLILTKNGYKKIIDCHNEDIVVPYTVGEEMDTTCIDGQKYSSFTTYTKGYITSEGIKLTYLVKFHNNSSIRVTESSKFLVPYACLFGFDDTFLWKELNELKVGDLVATNGKIKRIIDIKEFGLEDVYSISLSSNNFIANDCIIHI